jgi:hypothetical protein
LLLQEGLDGGAGQGPGGRDGRRLDGGQDVAVRGLLGNLLKLTGHEPRLLDEQGFQGGRGRWGPGHDQALLDPPILPDPTPQRHNQLLHPAVASFRRAGAP